MKKKRTLYEVLGVRPDDTPDTIKRVYRVKAKKYHPDTNPGNKRAANRYLEIVDAYEVLSDPVRRAEYDKTGTIGRRHDEENRDCSETIIEFLISAMKKVQMENRNVKKEPMVKMIIGLMDNEIKKIEKVVEDINRAINNMKEVSERITEDEPLVTAWLTGQVIVCNKDLEKAKTHLNLIVRSKAYYEKCGYKTDGPPVSTPTGYYANQMIQWGTQT